MIEYSAVDIQCSRIKTANGDHFLEFLPTFQIARGVGITGEPDGLCMGTAGNQQAG